MAEKSRPLLLALPDAPRLPLATRIARAITEAVRNGRLRPGAPLPGSRALAAQLGVHRNTVLAALSALVQEGWIETQAGRGTYVARALPEAPPRRFGGSVGTNEAWQTRAGYDVPKVRGALPGGDRREIESAAGRLSLVGGVPDPRLFPTAALVRAYRRVLRRSGAELLDYGETRGLLRLRRALAEMLARQRGLRFAEEEVFVTRGSQMAIDLVARALLEPGDVVAVEAFGYRPAWEALRASGAELVPVPVDASGLDVEALAELASERRLRAVYVTPHHQYPTTVALAPGRRLALLALARKHRFFILEDDYDHELHFEGRPLLPLASADPSRQVVYVGSLSKVLAPGVRIGYVVAPEEVATAIAAVRRYVDRQGDLAVEAAVADLLEDGELERHARKLRRIVHARRDALVQALRGSLEGALSFHVPAGGMTLWARAAAGMDVDAWAAAALERGVEVPTGRRYTFDGRPRPYFRFGFAHRTEDELALAVRRLAQARPAAGQRPPGRDAKRRATIL